MKIVILVENTRTPDSPLAARHGLSLHIKTDGRNILFDAGPDRAICDNAAMLGIDLAKVDIAILSHAYYDHGGGLEPFFAINTTAPVWLSAYARGRYFSRHGDGTYSSISLDDSLFDRYPDRFRFRFLDEDTTLVDSISLCCMRKNGGILTPGSGRLFREAAGCYEPDDFRHELVLAIMEGGRQVVFSGCGHSGIVNLLKAVRAHEPDLPIAAVIGGFHLVHLAAVPESERLIRDIAMAIRDLDVGAIKTGHCTGDKTFRILASVLGERISRLSTGMVIEI